MICTALKHTQCCVNQVQHAKDLHSQFFLFNSGNTGLSRLWFTKLVLENADHSGDLKFLLKLVEFLKFVAWKEVV